MELYREIGKRLKQYRNENKMTQKTASERAGIAQVSLARIEAGTLSARISTLTRLAAVYGRGLRVEFTEPEV